MSDVKVSIESRNKEDHPLVASLLAILLVVLCLWASVWQFNRGTARHELNSRIASHISQGPTSLEKIALNIDDAEWRKISIDGTFDSSHQILLRNRYSEGKYGFDLLTLFTATSGQSFWVDRGWIAPGADATSTPKLPITPKTQVSILGSVRLDHSLPRGSFFAIPSNNKENLISRWNAQAQYANGTEKYYVDLLDSSDPQLKPGSPVELPELTDGPHMAYALQWLFFAGMVVYGRILLRRSR